MSARFLAIAAVFTLSFGNIGAQIPQTEPSPVLLPTDVGTIAPDAVERYLVDHPDTIIIDVRTEDERRTRGYILNSLHHDYFHGQQTLDALAKLDKSKPCIVYCAIGGRAKFVAVDMHKLGFKNIQLLKGGFNAWTASGQAVAK
jgi:rhodanese-related sulfurtransferase